MALETNIHIQSITDLIIQSDLFINITRLKYWRGAVVLNLYGLHSIKMLATPLNGKKRYNIMLERLSTEYSNNSTVVQIHLQLLTKRKHSTSQRAVKSEVCDPIKWG